MKIKNVRYAELILTAALFWAGCWFFVWWLREPKACSVPTTNGFGVSGQSHDSLVKSKHASDNDRPLPVYIVEEHHEVIKYWFGAAEKGYIPKQGNVLLHIDGHSDGATPTNWMLGPLFRFPSSEADLRHMMQRNDVFVVAAALTGLINRYIWVWPEWNTDSFEGQSKYDYMSMQIRYGSAYRMDGGTGQPVLELCGCATSKELMLDNYCFMNNASDFEDMDGIPINESDCSIKYSGLIETVREREAIRRIKSGTWITANDNVLLDVDEDFYGVEAAVMPLYDAGMNQNDIDEISYLAEELVCASNTEQERQTDSFFNYLIQTVLGFINSCPLIETDNKKYCSNRWKKMKAILNLRPVFMNNLKDRNLQQHLCDDIESEKALKSLIFLLSKLDVSQLKALAEVGFCLNASPKTMEFSSRHSVRVCHGYNTPNDTAVMFYVPSVSEIEQRTNNLKQMLKQNQFVPGAVTICRSVRDGYTPRKYFMRIETDIKEVLKDAFPKIQEESFYYDENLLGGPSGWYDRH